MKQRRRRKKLYNLIKNIRGCVGFEDSNGIKWVIEEPEQNGCNCNKFDLKYPFFSRDLEESSQKHDAGNEGDKKIHISDSDGEVSELFSQGVPLNY